MILLVTDTKNTYNYSNVLPAIMVIGKMKEYLDKHTNLHAKMMVMLNL